MVGVTNSKCLSIQRSSSSNDGTDSATIDDDSEVSDLDCRRVRTSCWRCGCDEDEEIRACVPMVA